SSQTFNRYRTIDRPVLLDRPALETVIDEATETSVMDDGTETSAMDDGMETSAIDEATETAATQPSALPKKTPCRRPRYS
ncbi:hypothetical protein BG011_001961, partial [Mortierella polycephala]